ncbi:hypothetical protein PG991_013138 [Apiospora marii]|uniref:Uncharacterized protein n=1 Tax=Apiospora marii TaxID=335849 RepID=A0ABR1R5W1_9PEZI
MWQFMTVTFSLWWLATLARYIDRQALLLITQRALHTYLLAFGLLLGAALAAGATSVPYSYIHGRKAATTATHDNTYVFKDERAVAVILMAWLCWYGALVRSFHYEFFSRLTFLRFDNGRSGGRTVIYLRQGERDARAVLILASAVLALALCHPGFRALGAAGLRRLWLTDAVDRFAKWVLFAAWRTVAAEFAWRPRSRWDQVASGVRRQWRWLKFMALRRG